MNDKYYTPSIEEFHVGFEYYQNDKKYMYDKYDNNLFTKHYGFEENPSIEIELKSHTIKVKYLDKEDVESLGFKNIIDTQTFVKKINNDKAIIDFQDWEYIIIYNFEDNKVFEGNIKNKSELKRLLTQLNII